MTQQIERPNSNRENQIDLVGILQSDLQWTRVGVQTLDPIGMDGILGTIDQLNIRDAFQVTHYGQTVTVIKGTHEPPHPVIGESMTYTYFAVRVEDRDGNTQTTIDNGRLPRDLIFQDKRSIEEVIFNRASGKSETFIGRFLHPGTIGAAELEDLSLPARPVSGF